jgi:hypothetical protein
LSLSDEERRGRVGEYFLSYRAAIIVEGEKALADGWQPAAEGHSVVNKVTPPIFHDGAHCR